MPQKCTLRRVTPLVSVLSSEKIVSSHSPEYGEWNNNKGRVGRENADCKGTTVIYDIYMQFSLIHHIYVPLRYAYGCVSGGI